MYAMREMTSESNGRARAGVEGWVIGEGRRHKAPMPGGPELEIVIGAERGRAAGVLDVTVPVGAAMPEHDHGVSEALLVPRAGRLRLVEVGETERATELEPGALATIPVGCRVRLENTGDVIARLLVVLTPADLVAQIERWPVAEKPVAEKEVERDG